MTFWQKAERFNPIIVRMLARTRSKSPRLLTIEEIAERSGLDAFVVSSLAAKESWDGVPFDVMKKYLIGCDVDLCNSSRLRTQNKLLRGSSRGKYRYIRRSKDWHTLLRALTRLKNGRR